MSEILCSPPPYWLVYRENKKELFSSSGSIFELETEQIEPLSYEIRNVAKLVTNEINKNNSLNVKPINLYQLLQDKEL